MRFKDRVALVTGGGRGIGAACVRRFSEDGASVVIADVDGGPANEVAAEITHAGGHALALTCDVTDRGSVDSLFKAAIDRFGQVDFMVLVPAFFGSIPSRTSPRLNGTRSSTPI